MRLFKTRYENLYCSNPPPHLHLQIETAFYELFCNWWEMKVYKNDFRQMHITFHPKKVYLHSLSKFLIEKMTKEVQKYARNQKIFRKTGH
jgi:hypothetical protein